MALDNLMGWGLDKKQLSILARLGSGSAARSVYDGFVYWHAGTKKDGRDSYAEQLSNDWKEFRIGILEIVDPYPHHCWSYLRTIVAVDCLIGRK